MWSPSNTKRPSPIRKRMEDDPESHPNIHLWQDMVTSFDREGQVSASEHNWRGHPRLHNNPNLRHLSAGSHSPAPTICSGRSGERAAEGITNNWAHGFTTGRMKTGTHRELMGEALICARQKSNMETLPPRHSATMKY